MSKLTILSLLLLSLVCICRSQHMVTLIDTVPTYFPDTALAACMGIPGFAASNNYTVVSYGYWLSYGTYDALAVWANPSYYVAPNNIWGTTNAEIQRAWSQTFHSNGKLVFITLFGSSQWPTTAGLDPIATANSVAAFVINNYIDGVDICYEDNNAMDIGTGPNWLIQFTKQLVAMLPANIIITHSPQAPYFMESYPNGGYLTVNEEVGPSISWYNIQYFNQASSAYSTYETLFVESDGWANNTAVFQLESVGVPLEKIVIGKPVAQSAASNTGYIPLDSFSSIISQAVSSTAWKSGVMGWEYYLDASGQWINTLEADFL